MSDDVSKKIVEAPPKTRDRILVVDDSALMRSMLVKMLKNVGYADVLTAASGAQAFELLGVTDDPVLRRKAANLLIRRGFDPVSVRAATQIDADA